MVLVLLLTLFLALVSLVLWVHTRSVLVSAAADAARYAANADLPAGEAVDRVRDALAASIAGSTADTVRCETDRGEVMVGVRCTLRAPGIVGLLDGLLPDITVTGHAAREGVG